MRITSIPNDAASTSPRNGEVGREAAGRGSTGSRFSRTAQMTSRARRLRRDLTEAEKKLWQMLHRKQVADLSFRRQHPIGEFVLDFYCPAIRLAVEVDGGQHNEAIHRTRDDRRTQWLGARGITVLRFWNNDVIGNIEGVWFEIHRAIETLRLQNVTPSLTLPLSGGGD